MSLRVSRCGRGAGRVGISIYFHPQNRAERRGDGRAMRERVRFWRSRAGSGCWVCDVEGGMRSDGKPSGLRLAMKRVLFPGQGAPDGMDCTRR